MTDEYIYSEGMEAYCAELEQQLRIEREKYRIIADNTNCGLWEYDIEHKRLDQSKKLDGKWSDTNMIIENYRETVKSWGILHPEDVGVFDMYCDSMDRGDKDFQYDLRAITDEYTFKWLRYIGTTIYDSKGKALKVIGKTLDVTKKKNDRAALERKAAQDPLTHLYNKAYTKEMIDEHISEIGAKGNHVLYIIDIDNFKNINDRWGHLYGDYVLETFAEKIKSSFHAGDIIGRIGGDEFVVFCPYIADSHSAATTIAKRLLTNASEIELKNNEKLTISVGAAVFPKHGHTYDALYKSADIALYEAKRSGKNCFSLYSRMAAYESNIGEKTRKNAGNDNTYGNAAGEDYRKNVGKLGNIEKNLFNYSFDTISRYENFNDAVNDIFEEIGKYFGLDRISVMEYNFLLRKLDFSYEWNRIDINYEAHTNLKELCRTNWSIIEQRYCGRERYYFYSAKDDPYDDSIHTNKVFALTDIKSMLQMPLIDGEKLVGVITYESHDDNYEWDENTIATLFSITKMISSYMLRLRSKTELEDEILYNGVAMDTQQATYYVINPQTYELKYISRYADKLFPNIKIGATCYSNIMGRPNPCPNCPIKGLSEENKIYSLETYIEKRETWFSATAAEVVHEGRERECLVSWSDVTAFLERVTSTDKLTGALTYDKFKAEALRIIPNSDSRYYFIFMGIKDFAGINDVFGYKAGDEVLKCTAAQFSSILSYDELLCRVKGDDFVLMLNADGIISAKDRVLNACRQIELLMRDGYPTMNINCIGGAYLMNDTDYSISAEIDKANRAKRKAAEQFSSDNHRIVEYGEDIDIQANEEHAIERSMVNALSDGQFHVYFQPKVDTKSECVEGAEALVRWIKPDGTIVSNGKFIPIFEKNGFIVEMDKFVYNQLFGYIRKWLSEGKKVPVISMNVSRLHLFDETFPDYLNDLAKQYGIPNDLIEIEITESVFFDNIEKLIMIISRLQSKGFLISMDDFGTGYSTLSLMKSMPIDIIKIDGSFFLQSDLDDKNKAVISSIIHLSKNLNYKIVAEGIETQEQADYIRKEAVDYAQGFFYYKPMSAENFEKIL